MNLLIAIEEGESSPMFVIDSSKILFKERLNVALEEHYDEKIEILDVLPPNKDYVQIVRIQNTPDDGSEPYRCNVELTPVSLY